VVLIHQCYSQTDGQADGWTSTTCNRNTRFALKCNCIARKNATGHESHTCKQRCPTYTLPFHLLSCVLDTKLLTRIRNPESSLFIGLIRAEVNFDNVGASVHDVTCDVTSDARPVSPALSISDDVLDPVSGTEVAGKQAEVVVKYLEEDFSGALV